MTQFQLLLRSLFHHRRMNAAVALGVTAATAVLTGALLVGDSVRGSLRGLTLERLGRIDEVLVLDRFFREEMVRELASSESFQRHFEHSEPAIFFPQATIERKEETQTQRASSVMVLGVRESFWQLDSTGLRPDAQPGDDEIVLNAALATELHAKVGDEVTIRLPKSVPVPADSPLANKDDRIRGVPNLKVVAIVPTAGLGRFTLSPSQSLPLNAFVAPGTLQVALDQPEKVNAIFVGGAKSSARDAPDLAGQLRPTLDDFGITVKPVRATFRRGDVEQVAFEYHTITTDRMIFSKEVDEAIRRVVTPLGGQPLLTYLANNLERVAASDPPHAGIPYSMVTAIDVGAGLPLVDVSGQPIGALAEDEIVLHSWTADDLKVALGDKLRIHYFEPETTHGNVKETSREFTLKAVTPLIKPNKSFRGDSPAEYDQAPALANDPRLTPEVAGVTDQDTIDDWDAPFPFDYKRVRPEIDEPYWEAYRTTPKAFVSLVAGRQMWGNRFGVTTSFRVPLGTKSLDELRSALQAELSRDLKELGFSFLPIRQRQLEASRGTTPFDVLFLSLSFFVIAAALLLVVLLFRLGIEQRSREIGTLLAVGFDRRTIARLLVGEGAFIAACGAALGVTVGIGYARLMLAGLSSWWLGAISTPFLVFHATPLSLILGFVLGTLTAVLVIAWTVRDTRHLSTRRLLTGQTHQPPAVASVVRRRGRPSLLLILGGLGLAAVAPFAGGMQQAGAFVGAGAMVLAGLLWLVSERFRRPTSDRIESWCSGNSLWRLAKSSASRNPGRSTITIALMATATFLIVAMSSFRLAPTESGVGGFSLLATSAEPIYANLNSLPVRAESFGSNAPQLAGTSIYGFRMRGGDDASCNNLYQATQPRVMGVTTEFSERFAQPGNKSFAFAGWKEQPAPNYRNPWDVLNRAGDGTEAVPAVLDKNTAMYSLHLYRGIGEEFTFDYDGRPIQFRVAGLLENSVLQGSLLIGEAEFRRLFPDISGYRFFLLATPAGKSSTISGLLEERFGDQGLDVVDSREVLTQLLAVQNTYLSTFQSLGALGLLLGAFGLATVQLRNVLERRGELALMRAIGFRRQRLGKLVLLENVALLVGGLFVGGGAALLAVLPHKLFGEAAFSWDLLRDLALMLAAILVVGIGSGFLSVRAVLRLPLLASLRGE